MDESDVMAMFMEMFMGGGMNKLLSYHSHTY